MITISHRHRALAEAICAKAPGHRKQDKRDGKKYADQRYQSVLVGLIGKLAHRREDDDELKDVVGKGPLTLGDEEAPKTLFPGWGR